MPKEVPKESEQPVVQIVVSGVPAELLEQIDKLAEQDDRTRAAWVRRVLAEAVERCKHEHQQAA